MSQHFIIVGAGQAGLQVADSLRKEGFEDRITLFGDETTLPYQRPPLSKKYLEGSVNDDRLLIRPATFYEKNDVTVELGKHIDQIDRGRHEIVLDDGSRVHYDKLALTTGARVRELPLPGADDPRVMYLRSLKDSRRIRSALEDAERVVVVGGGFIGLEFAAIARGLKKMVTVVEAQQRLMERAVSEKISAYFQQLHESHGVDFALSAGVETISCGSVVGVGLANGTTLEADLVVVGIGVEPNLELADGAGLEVDGGIVVDEYVTTSDPDIVAAGDCTMHRNAALDVSHRLESVQNAIGQAKIAASSMLGKRNAYREWPWFWSDQYDKKLQMIGISRGFDQHVLRGDPESGTFSVFYFKAGEFLAADSVSAPLDHMICRKLCASGVTLDPAQAADQDFDLKSLVQS